MKNPRYSPDTKVEEQRGQAPDVRRYYDFLLRYLRAADHYNNENGTGWREDQDEAYNTMYPPKRWTDPKDFHGLPPDAGKFKNHWWDQYILGQIKR